MTPGLLGCAPFGTITFLFVVVSCTKPTHTAMVTTINGFSIRIPRFQDSMFL